jgi:hypothetical protein
MTSHYVLALQGHGVHDVQFYVGQLAIRWLNSYDCCSIGSGDLVIHVMSVLTAAGGKHTGMLLFACCMIELQ